MILAFADKSKHYLMCLETCRGNVNCLVLIFWSVALVIMRISLVLVDFFYAVHYSYCE